MKSWFITGGTPGGLGVAFADEVLCRGDQVALTTRRPDQLTPHDSPPPRQLVLGGAGFDRTVQHLGESLDGIRSNEKISRGVDYAAD